MQTATAARMQQPSTGPGVVVAVADDDVQPLLTNSISNAQSTRADAESGSSHSRCGTCGVAFCCGLSLPLLILAICVVYLSATGQLATCGDYLCVPMQPPTAGLTADKSLLQSTAAMDNDTVAASSASSSSAASSVPSVSPPTPAPHQSTERGYVAVLYAGTVRSFSVAFHSHLIHLLASCPYTVHMYFHAATTGDMQHNATAARESTHPDWRSLNATLNYYTGWVNVDGEFVRVWDAVKWMRLEDEGYELEHIKARYGDTLSFIGDNWIDARPEFVLAAIDSLKQVTDASTEYERRTGIEYQYVVRIRYDTVLRSDLWAAVFNITARQTADSSLASSINSSFVLRDSVYRAVLDPSVLHVPICEQHGGGWNDQLAVSSPAIATLLANRGHDIDAMRILRAEDSQWKFHAENYYKRHIVHHNITQAWLPVCYSNLRYSLKPSGAGSLGNPSACSWHYGGYCCALHCPVMDEQRKAWQARLSQTVQQTTGTTSLSTPSLEQYVSSLPVEWGLTPQSSNWYRYWLQAEDVQRWPCYEAEWEDRWDPFIFHQLPFISTNASHELEYRRERLCFSA